MQGVIPVKGLLLSKAFERLFDLMQPDAEQLRAAIAQTSVVTTQEAVTTVRTDHLEAWTSWDAARREVQQFFYSELAAGNLTTYRRDPATGELLAIGPHHWMAPQLLPEVDDEEPPMFVLKAEFDDWLQGTGLIQGSKGVGKKGKKKRAPDRELAIRALEELFPGGVPDQAVVLNKTVVDQVVKWCREHEPQRKKPSTDTILRAAGRKT
jgi:hypothetical protein